MVGVMWLMQHSVYEISPYVHVVYVYGGVLQFHKFN